MPRESDYLPASLRKVVRDRARNLCEYCCCPADYSSDPFTVDHTQPRQAGGQSILENLAWTCQGCNGSKHIRTSFTDPETQQNTPLFNPRQQAWTDHFQWSADFTEMIGLTACGRATIAALKLNRLGVVNLRRLLITAQLHPPD
jgi:5-methylcytosine-specific restriction endonuclease McrA